MSSRYILSLLVLLLISSCANIIAPTGGPKDVTAPNILTRSLADSAVQYKGGTIKFSFNEKLQSTGVVLDVFPLMRKKPEFTILKNNLYITIPDSLLEDNTTYKFSFGKTIKDLNEGNALDNLAFTLSTGNNIDSLYLQGEVVQAELGLPDTGVYVGLYGKLLSDTDITYRNPLYITKTNELGRYIFTNLPNKAFYLFAVKSKNNNYLYDAPSERIAFMDSAVQANMDSKSFIKLYTFVDVTDTFKPKASLLKKGKSKVRLNTNIDTIAKGKRTQDITKPILLTHTNTIGNLDISKIRLFQDSVLDASAIVALDSTQKIVSIQTDWLADTNYYLQLMEGYATDSNKNLPSAQFPFRTKSEKDYGSIIVQYNKPMAAYQYLLRLWNKKVLIAEKILSAEPIKFSMLAPGSYQLQVVHDTNNNGKWDTGSFRNPRKQPELIEAYSTDIMLKPNMENKITWQDAKPTNKK